jgi:hypothetical protein
VECAAKLEVFEVGSRNAECVYRGSRNVYIDGSRNVTKTPVLCVICSTVDRKNVDDDVGSSTPAHLRGIVR